MEKSYSAATPLDVKVKLNLAESDDKKINCKEYQTIIGSLKYIVLVTRPNISFAVAVLSRYYSCRSTLIGYTNSK